MHSVCSKTHTALGRYGLSVICRRFGFQLGNQPVDAFGFDDFAELVAVHGNQARAFDGDVVGTVFAAALVGGKVHIDGLLTGDADFGTDDDFLAALIDDGIVFDVDGRVLNFSIVPE